LSAEVPVDTGVAEAAAEPRPPARRACVVMLGGRPFAVDVTEAREVVVLDVTTPVPGAPPGNTSPPTGSAATAQRCAIWPTG